MGAFDDILNRNPGHASVDDDPVTSRVVRVDSGDNEDGVVWVVPIDGDLDTPIGPCRGARASRVDDIVLLVWANGEPWVVTDRPAEADGSIEKSVFTAAGQLLLGTDPAEYVVLPASGAGKVLTTVDPDDNPDRVEWATRRDTGDVVLAAAGTVTDHPGMTVTVRRIDNTVTVYLVETSNATGTSVTTVATLPDGYRFVVPTGGVGAVAPAYDLTGPGPTGTVVVLTGGTVRVHGTTGQRHCAALTGTTADDWPS